MHIHKISNQKHIHFLKEERKDPITGDLVLEGDEVVFCAECKSAFLKSSWEYIGKRHCESSKTLSEFPSIESLSLKIQSSNNPFFIIKGSITNNKKKLENNTDNFWRKGNHFIRIPSSIQNSTITKSVFSLNKNLSLNIGLFYSFIFSFLILILSDLNLLERLSVCIIMLLSFITPIFIYSIRPNLYLKTKELPERDLSNQPIIYFENEFLSIYFESDKTAYRIDYKDIIEINFNYSFSSSLHLTQINILTSIEKKISFKLHNYSINDNDYINKLKQITKIVNSKSNALLTFCTYSSSSSSRYQPSETVEEVIEKYLINEKTKIIENSKTTYLS